MAEFMRLMARDGHEFDAWLVAPPGTARGAVVVVQEIFGVNAHIRDVAAGFAADGYLVIAPSLFDRVKRNVELDYSPESVQQGRGYALQITREQLQLDLAASINVVRHAGKVGIVGYCWGGTVTYIAACTVPVAAAVAYYGTRIAENLDLKPQVPVMYHFGSLDKGIPPEAIERIRANDPGGEFHVYEANHGFNCTPRAVFDAASSKLARSRTLEFLGRHLVAGD